MYTEDNSNLSKGLQNKNFFFFTQMMKDYSHIYKIVVMNKDSVLPLENELKRRFSLPSDEEISFFFEKTNDLSFLDKKPLSTEEITKIQRDYFSLFPYKEDKTISFSFYALSKNHIFLFDVLPSEKYESLSPYKIFQFEEKLEKELTSLKLDKTHLSLLSDLFHQKIEKLQLLNLLNNEISIKKQGLQIHEIYVLDGNEEENKLYSDFIYIMKKVIKEYVEKIGLVEKDENKLITALRIKMI